MTDSSLVSTGTLLEKYTALYSELDIAYAQVMSGPYEDLSIHRDDVEVVVGAKDGKLSGFWRPVVAAGNGRLAAAYIGDLLEDYESITFMDWSSSQLHDVGRMLLEKGYKATPHYTQVITLCNPEKILKHNLRKSYKSLVVKGSPTITYKVDPIWVLKKGSRCGMSWEIQQEMCDKGEAFCIYDDEGAILIYHNKHTAYYASAVSNGNTHHLIWAAMMKLKEMGVQTLEMGEQIFSGDPKLVNISKFKRGFGGTTMTRMIYTKD